MDDVGLELRDALGDTQVWFTLTTDRPTLTKGRCEK